MSGSDRRDPTTEDWVASKDLRCRWSLLVDRGCEQCGGGVSPRQTDVGQRPVERDAVRGEQVELVEAELFAHQRLLLRQRLHRFAHFAGRARRLGHRRRRRPAAQLPPPVRQLEAALVLLDRLVLDDKKKETKKRTPFISFDQLPLKRSATQRSWRTRKPLTKRRQPRRAFRSTPLFGRTGRASVEMSWAGSSPTAFQSTKSTDWAQPRARLSTSWNAPSPSTQK